MPGSDESTIFAPLVTSEDVERIASVCHAANRAYCQAHGDFSQPEWENAPDWQKDSAREGVRLQLEHPETTPEMHHKSWSEAKTRDGWKFGPVKDSEKKEHPCLVPYEHLPFFQQVKDHLFAGIVRAMAPAGQVTRLAPSEAVRMKKYLDSMDRCSGEYGQLPMSILKPLLEDWFILTGNPRE